MPRTPFMSPIAPRLPRNGHAVHAPESRASPWCRRSSRWHSRRRRACRPPYRRFNANLNARGCRPSGGVSEVLVLVRLAGVEPATLGLEVTFLQRPTFRRLPADPRVPHECTGVRPMTSGCAALVTATVTAVFPR